MTSRVASGNFACRFATLVTLAISLFVSDPAFAQVAGATLQGTVTDASGSAVPNADISISNTATTVTRAVKTDAAGFYSAPNLTPGVYDVTGTATGFSTQVQAGIRLTVGAEQVVNFSLKVGQVSEVVHVTTEAPTVELASSSISTDIDSATVRELPLNGRDWSSLAVFEPGVIGIRTQTATSGTANRGTRGFGNQLAIDGHPAFANNYRVNGISINDYSNASPGSVIGLQLGVDAIQEFSVVATNYSADYGRTSGGIINAITKSGTNQFHGSAFWFLRDEGLDARNYFDPAQIPPFHRNQFGASAGGPIKKDRTFFFADYEGVRQDLSLSFHNVVPTAAARAGNLCSVPTTGSCVPNTITVNQLVVPYFAFYSLPNAGLTPTGNGDTGFFNASALQVTPENYVAARVDHKISDKDSLDGSWFFDRSHQDTPDNLLNSISETFSQRQMVGLEETHIFSPTLVNTVRFGYSRTQARQGIPVSAINPLAADPSLGLGGGRNAPILTVPGLAAMQGGLGDGSVSKYTQNSFQYYDDAFLTRGTHSIKIGFAFERIQENALAAPRPNGNFTFPSLTGFLLNQPTSALLGDRNHSRVLGYRQSIFGVYVQDDWRFRSNLTLNLGLRYEPTTLPSEAHNQFSIVQDFFGGGLVNVQHLWQTNQTLRNFAPRIGFSWDPFRNGKTAVRGGFGIFDVLPLPFEYQLDEAQTYPNSLQLSANSLPAGSFPTGALSLLSFSINKVQGYHPDQNPKNNYAMNWNFNIQREIKPNLTAMIGYAGSRSLHNAFTADDTNMVLPTLTSAGWLWPIPVGSGTVLNPNIGDLRPTFWGGDGFYESFLAQITKKMSHSFQVQGSFTWAKCIDTGSATGGQGDPETNSIAALIFFNQQARRGLCDYQVAHNFVANYIWDVPAPRLDSRILSATLGGWEVGGILTASSGTPFTLLIAGDPLGQKSTSNADFPSRMSGCNPVNGNYKSSGLVYLNVNCFVLPSAPASLAAQCQPFDPVLFPNTCRNLFGNAGRNAVIGPGLFDLDFSLFKNNYIKNISETFNIQFRTEFFNILNHTNFQSPIDNETIFNQNGTRVGAAGTLDATTTTSRQIQFGLKVIW